MADKPTSPVPWDPCDDGLHWVDESNPDVCAACGRGSHHWHFCDFVEDRLLCGRPCDVTGRCAEHSTQVNTDGPQP